MLKLILGLLIGYIIFSKGSTSQVPVVPSPTPPVVSQPAKEPEFDPNQLTAAEKKAILEQYHVERTVIYDGPKEEKGGVIEDPEAAPESENNLKKG